MSKKYPVIFAVDFDGTLCRHDFPRIGHGNQGLIEKLIEVRRNGSKLILWTCRHGEYLRAAVEWCKERGLEFDAVNDDLPEVVESFGSEKSRKVFANFYIDDRNMSVIEAMTTLSLG